jgi:hypothetical protein
MESSIIYKPQKDDVPRSYIEQKVESANATILKDMLRMLGRIEDKVSALSVEHKSRIEKYMTRIRSHITKLEDAAEFEDNDSVLGLLISIRDTFKAMGADRDAVRIFDRIFQESHMQASLICLDNDIEILRQRAKLTDRAVLRLMRYTNGLLTAEVWYKHKDKIMAAITDFIQQLRSLSFNHIEVRDCIQSLESKLRQIQEYKCDLNEEPQKHIHECLFLEMEEDWIRRDSINLLNRLNPEGPNSWRESVLSNENFEELDAVVDVFYRTMVQIRNKANREINSRSKVKDSVDREQVRMQEM